MIFIGALHTSHHVSQRLYCRMSQGTCTPPTEGSFLPPVSTTSTGGHFSHHHGHRTMDGRDGISRTNKAPTVAAIGRGIAFAKGCVAQHREKKEDMLTRINACKVNLALPSDVVSHVYTSTTTAWELQQELLLLQEQEMATNLYEDLNRDSSSGAYSPERSAPSSLSLTALKDSTPFASSSPLPSPMAQSQSRRSRTSLSFTLPGELSTTLPGGERMAISDIQHPRSRSSLSHLSTTHHVHSTVHYHKSRPPVKWDNILTPQKLLQSEGTAGTSGLSTSMSFPSFGKPTPTKVGTTDRTPSKENIQAFLSVRRGNAGYVGFDEDKLEEYTRSLRPSIHRSCFDHDKLAKKIARQVDELRSESRIERKRREQEEKRAVELGMDRAARARRATVQQMETDEMPEIWSFEKEQMKEEARRELKLLEKGTSASASCNQPLVQLHYAVQRGVSLPELTKLRQKLDDLETFGLMDRNEVEFSEARKKVALPGTPQEGGGEFRTIGTKQGMKLLRTTRWCPWKEACLLPEPWEKGEQNVVFESDTNIPPQDLHLYQIFCANRNMVIIMRPVSPAVPSLYAGNYFLHTKYCDLLGMPVPQPQMSKEELRKVTSQECRVRGKSINVSLKSSSYPPIDGLIPVNPALGKAYLDAQRREREIEDMILSAQGGVLTINLLRKLKAQKAQAGSLTQAFVRDIQRALSDSDVACAKLMEEYKQQVILTVDKAAVSRRYLDSFNEAQFLGTTEAKWRGYSVYYAVKDNDVVQRNEQEIPYFYIKKDNHYYQYSPAKMDCENDPVRDSSHLKVVEVVTHRTFYMSPTTHRIEEEEDAYLIGPDFDGLSYAEKVDPSLTLDAVKAKAQQKTKPYLSKSMGLVTDADVEHVKEMRALTEWKQNHGYESGNTVKTQTLGKGTYVVITPHCVKILEDFQEIIGFYRSAWTEGVPLQLNANWKVVVDHLGLPCPYGEETAIPIIDDCGHANLLSKMEAEGGGYNYKELVKLYESLDVRSHRLESGVKHFSSDILNEAANYNQEIYLDMLEVEDKKILAKHFYEVRRWQLLPPWWRELQNSLKAHPAMVKLRKHAHKGDKEGEGEGGEEEEGEEEMEEEEEGDELPEEIESRPGSPEGGERVSRRRAFNLANSVLPHLKAALVRRNESGLEYYFDEEFEEYRKEHVRELMEAFDKQAAMYDRIHHRNQFIPMLRDYLRPEDEPTDVFGENFVANSASMAHRSIAMVL